MQSRASSVKGGQISGTSNDPSVSARGNLSFNCSVEREIPPNAHLSRDVYTAVASYENELWWLFLFYSLLFAAHGKIIKQIVFQKTTETFRGRREVMDLFPLPKLALGGFLSSGKDFDRDCFSNKDLCVCFRAPVCLLLACILFMWARECICVFAPSALIHLLLLKCPLGTKGNYFTVCCI